MVGVLLFAAITSLLYQDVAVYLQQQHPGTVIYALTAKIIIVYGALAFVLWQFRPEPEPSAPERTSLDTPDSNSPGKEPQNDGPLSALEDVSHKDHLRSRYERVLKGDSERSE